MASGKSGAMRTTARRCANSASTPEVAAKILVRIYILGMRGSLEPGSVGNSRSGSRRSYRRGPARDRREPVTQACSTGATLVRPRIVGRWTRTTRRFLTFAQNSAWPRFCELGPRRLLSASISIRDRGHACAPRPMVQRPPGTQMQGGAPDHPHARDISLGLSEHHLRPR